MSVEYEKENWDKYYEQTLVNQNEQDETTLWWQIADRDAVNLVKESMHDKPSITVLEAGCGSGATSFYLSNYILIEKLTLLDISPNALQVARRQQPINLCNKVNYIQGNIFESSKILSNKFDLVWNIGLIEHYSKEEIKKIIQEMYLLTSQDGCLIVGIPNRKSIPVIKAALLGSSFGQKFLYWIKGYRNTSEILYSDYSIKKIIHSVTNENVNVNHGGSYLWVGAPNAIIKFTNRFLNIKKLSFLTFFIVKKTKA